jgi:DNA-binding transcriptional MerR regulator
MKWTKKEENKIVKAWKKGLTIKAIAELFPERSIGSVTNRITKLRKEGLIDGRQKKTRKKEPIIDSTVKEKMRETFKNYGDSPYEKKFGSFTSRKNPYMTHQDLEDRKHMSSTFRNNDTSAMKIIKTMEEIRLFLIKKNEQYGDSVMSPIRIFSKADKSEQIKVRIDDKLNRLVQGNANIESDEDVIKDLIGYLILLLIQMKDTQ